MFINIIINKYKMIKNIKSGLKIGQRTKIYNNVDFGSEPYLVTIHEDVKIASGVKFITHDGAVHVLRNYYQKPDIDLFGKIIVKSNVFIGMNCIILPNTTINENSIIGAGSIVTKDVEPNSIYAGSPAKKISTIDEYFKKNSKYFLNTKSLNRKNKKKNIENLRNMGEFKKGNLWKLL